MSSVLKQNKGYVSRSTPQGKGAMQKSQQCSLCCVGGLMIVSMITAFNHLKPVEFIQEPVPPTSISFRYIDTAVVEDIVEALPEPLIEPIIEPVEEKPAMEIPQTNKLMADVSDFTVQEKKQEEIMQEPKKELKEKIEEKPKQKPKPKKEKKVEKKPETKIEQKTETKPEPIIETKIDSDTTTENSSLPTSNTTTNKVSNSQTSLSAEQERIVQKNAFTALLREIERHKKYPKAARRNKTEGTIYLLVQLDAHGKVIASSIATNHAGKSGPAILEKATIELGKNLVGFVVPNEMGKAFSLRIPIEYVLK